jgi:predicted nucleotide-binding protein (sugar kinase/HSP70/actin superfamily)
MLAEGASRVVADTCLPAKVFVGHVASLVADCDCVFIPAVRSLKGKVYNCAKFLGLPDMTGAVIPESPEILDIDIDINLGNGALYRSIYRLGRHFSWNPLRVRRAARAAWQAHGNYRELMLRERRRPPEAIMQLTGTAPAAVESAVGPVAAGPTATIALVGHPYMLYDEHVNYHLIRTLEAYGASVVVPEMLAAEAQEAAVGKLVGRAYWTYEEDVVGAGGHFLQSEADGVIGVMAFGCGPDSLMMDLLHRFATGRQSTPFMCLTLEEHTSETGVITRIEAFLDMIHRRKRGRAVVCA